MNSVHMILIIMAVGIASYFIGLAVGRSQGLKPYADGMDFCDHLRRYSECGYCSHLVKPRTAS